MDIQPFIRKLDHGADLTDTDRGQLSEAVQHTALFKAGDDVSSQGEVPRNVHVVMAGWACRYKILEDGSRQIVAIFLPGDMCDLHVQILKKMDHGIGVLTDAEVAQIRPSTINTLTDNPRINLALSWATLADEGTLREWLVNVGQRPANARLAHLFCELYVRLKAVGLADNGEFDVPLTQTQLADVVGMTLVHVNRTLAVLRKARFIETNARRVQICDFAKLADFGGFEPSYLHLSGTKPGATV